MSETFLASPVQQGRALLASLLLVIGDPYTTWLLARSVAPSPRSGLEHHVAAENGALLRFRWRAAWSANHDRG